MTLLVWFIRGVSGLIGVTLFYIVVFVYKGCSEDRLHDRVEYWWIQFDDLQKRMLSRQKSLVILCARKTLAGLDLVLSRKYYSRDARTASSAFFLGSLFTTLAYSAGEDRRLAIGIGVFFIGTAVIPALSPKLRVAQSVAVWIAIGVWWFWLVTTIDEYIRYLATEPRSPLRGRAAAELGMIMGFLCGFYLGRFLNLYVAIKLRRLLRNLSRQCSRPKDYAAVLAAPLFLNIITFGSIYSLVALDTLGINFVTFLIAPCLAAGMALGAAIVAVLAIPVLMIIHRVIWPVLSRLLYTLPGHELVKNKKLLNLVGAVFLGFAWKGTGLIGSLLKLLGFS
ncbi:hypothetical protein [Paraburkholderia sp. DGU8]|uniref:hypothetical protein n=1 Tax=Paraburkholderia sp. DGU8 TaxID=3161997 RepID=UPI003466BF43